MSIKIKNESMRIAGKKVDAEKVIEVEYPYTKEIIGTVPAGNAEHAKKALDIIFLKIGWETLFVCLLNT